MYIFAAVLRHLRQLDRNYKPEKGAKQKERASSAHEPSSFIYIICVNATAGVGLHSPFRKCCRNFD